MESSLGRVALLSAEPWDEVWRRNQHIAVRLVRLGLAESVVFVCPPSKVRHRVGFEPEPGLRVVTPHFFLPRDRGGLALAGGEIRNRFLRYVDVLWINDAVLGVRCLRSGLPSMYDVTDDWRAARLSSTDRSRLVAAEDALSRAVKTIVCSEVLRDRWFERYGVTATVIHNGVDVEAHADARPLHLAGPHPHAVYVGTLHHERLDLRLLTELAVNSPGTVHLVGPDHLDDASRHLLQATDGIILHGRVTYTDVPRWMASADLLICPHRVDEFTLSLDAIKSFEYLASGRAVVATPTSGFQSLGSYDGLHVVDPERFVSTAIALMAAPSVVDGRRVGGHDWSSPGARVCVRSLASRGSACLGCRNASLPEHGGTVLCCSLERDGHMLSSALAATSGEDSRSRCRRARRSSSASAAFSTAI